jgi:hypothetical protein
MASLRVVVTLVLALTLCFAASVSAQAVGPICLQAGEGQRRQIFEIFALSMGSTSNRAQFLLSAVSLDLPYSGAASVEGQIARFTFIAAFPFDLAAGAFSGVIDLQTGMGQGACSAIDPTQPPSPGACTTVTSLTYVLVSCGTPPPPLPPPA